MAIRSSTSDERRALVEHLEWHLTSSYKSLYDSSLPYIWDASIQGYVVPYHHIPRPRGGQFTGDSQVWEQYVRDAVNSAEGWDESFRVPIFVAGQRGLCLTGPSKNHVKMYVKNSWIEPVAVTDARWPDEIIHYGDSTILTEGARSSSDFCFVCDL